MNGEQFSQLDERLRGIETNSSATHQQLSNLNERLEKVEDHVDQIRLSLAEKKGEEKEAKKHAAQHGRRAGLIGGGIVSIIVTAISKWFFG